MVALLALAVFPAALLIAAANDLYEHLIPNWTSALLAAAYFVAAFGLGAPTEQIVEGAVIGAVAFAVCFSMFAFKLFGGGDAKLLAATTPWVGLAGLAPFVFNMAVAGGVFVLVLIAFRKAPALPIYAQAPWLMRLHQRPKDMPYGVAIAAGGLMTFSQTPNFQLAFGG